MASGCLGVGSLKASASGHVSVVRVGKAGCLPVGKNTHPRRDAKTPTPIALHASHPNLFHHMGGLRKGNDGPQRFRLRLIGAGNRFCCGFRLQRRQHNGNPDVSS
jgi:hypothetical protein